MSRRACCRLLATAAGGLPFLGLPQAYGAEPLEEVAVAMKQDLVERVMPYWYDTTMDRTRGGYVLSDDAVRAVEPAKEKMIVTQARMVWGFAHAYRKGFGRLSRDYLKAARHGYEFLVKRFLDTQHGGYYWKTDLEGNPTNDRKYLYGESFVIYAFVEYARASRQREPIVRAMDLYRAVQKHCRNEANGGWLEHAERDWTPILTQDPRIEVEVAGYRSANAHLHWMEALSELYEATGDLGVKASLEEALKINATWFYPPEGGKASFHRQPDWSPVLDARSTGVSYGHNVEFAWLMVRAEEVLGRAPSWAHFDSIMAHALQYGFDHQWGGLYNRGFGDQPATDTDKVWWSQAEMLAALTDGLQHGPNPGYAAALEKLVRFIQVFQREPKKGIWYDTVAADGKPKRTDLAHNWKANYHDVRGMVKFIEAFTPKEDILRPRNGGAVARPAGASANQP